VPVTGVAALKLALPPWLAVMLQVPGSRPPSAPLVALTEQIVGVLVL
jgi:hypothetical protein